MKLLLQPRTPSRGRSRRSLAHICLISTFFSLVTLGEANAQTFKVHNSTNCGTYVLMTFINGSCGSTGSTQTDCVSIASGATITEVPPVGYPTLTQMQLLTGSCGSLTCGTGYVCSSPVAAGCICDSHQFQIQGSQASKNFKIDVLS